MTPDRTGGGGGRLERDRLEWAGRLLAGVAHEIGNPLNSISTLAQASRRKLQDERLQEKMDKLVGQVDRIQKLLREALEMVEPVPEAWREASPLPALRLAADRRRFDKPSRRVEVQLELPEALPRVRHRHEALAHALQTLLIAGGRVLSAGRVDGAGASLVLSAAEASGRVEVVLAARGEPLEASAWERSLDPEQAGEVDLGLVRELVREHGGELALRAGAGEARDLVVSLPICREVAS